LYEKGQFGESLNMLEIACSICEGATKEEAKTGFDNRTYVPRLTADLYSTIGAIEYEKCAPGYGAKWMAMAKALRQDLADAGDAYDVFMLQMSNVNIALRLLAEASAREALPLMLRSLELSKDSEIQKVVLTNLSVCYRMLGSHAEAMRCCEEAVRIIEQDDGVESSTMALFGSP
jgi:tetratricopeptide (TPR) repeat protein